MFLLNLQMKPFCDFVAYKKWKEPVQTITYSSADSWKPPIYVSDLLIFSCGNLRLYQKKK